MRSFTKTLARASILAGLASMTGTANAADAWATDTVNQVYPLGNGSFVIVLVNSPPACPNTNSPRYLYVVAGENGVTADGVKAMLATSLAAMAMGKQLQVNFSDSTASCYVNRLMVIN